GAHLFAQAEIDGVAHVANDSHGLHFLPIRADGDGPADRVLAVEVAQGEGLVDDADAAAFVPNLEVTPADEVDAQRFEIAWRNGGEVGLARTDLSAWHAHRELLLDPGEQRKAPGDRFDAGQLFEALGDLAPLLG